MPLHIFIKKLHVFWHPRKETKLSNNPTSSAQEKIQRSSFSNHLIGCEAAPRTMKDEVKNRFRVARHLRLRQLFVLLAHCWQYNLRINYYSIWKKILSRSTYSTVVVRNFIYEEIAECTLINPGTRLVIYAPRKERTTFSSYLALLVWRSNILTIPPHPPTSRNNPNYFYLPWDCAGHPWI